MNQTCAASESTPPSRPRINVRRVRALVVLLLCAGGLWFLFPNSAPVPEVTILPPDYSVPAPPLPLPDRWIPMKWDWLWRLRYALLGRPATVEIETRLFRFGATSKSLPLEELLNDRAPLTTSNGVHAWILSEQDLVDMFGRRLKQKGHYSVRISRMTTGPGILANQSMTTTVPIDGAQVPVGDSFTQAVLKRGKSVELTGSFISWEVVTNTSTRLSGHEEMISLRTNLTLAANLLIPPGLGVFLLDTNRANTESSGTGLFISAKLR